MSMEVIARFSAVGVRVVRASLLGAVTVLAVACGGPVEEPVVEEKTPGTETAVAPEAEGQVQAAATCCYAWCRDGHHQFVPVSYDCNYYSALMCNDGRRGLVNAEWIPC